MDSKDCVCKTLAEMTKSERQAFVSQFGKEAIKQWDVNEKDGEYDRCLKTDWCAKFHDEKKRQERREVEKLEARLNEQAILIAELSKKVFG